MFYGFNVVAFGLVLAAIAVSAFAIFHYARGRPWLRLLSGIVGFCVVAMLVVVIAVVAYAVLAQGGDY